MDEWAVVAVVAVQELSGPGGEGASLVPIALVSGVLPIVMGVLLIFARRQVPRLIHTGLKRFYGEPVADTSMNERTGPRWVVLVGSALVVLGTFDVMEAFGVFGS